jgi:YHS domain-containing protein
MRGFRFWKNAVVFCCIAGVAISGAALAQTGKNANTDKGKKVAEAKKLKPQTVCPVMGGEIDKTKFVDFNGKRIYVCCAGCLDEFKKNPEKYLKKLAKMGQEPEAVAANDSAGTAPKRSEP